MNRPCSKRTLRPLAMAVGVALALTAGCTTAGAQPGYVFYYGTFDDWVVICALDEPTGRKDCRLSAPDPSFVGTSGATDIRIDIVEPSEGEAVVAVHIQEAVETGRPALLKVDGGARHQAALARTGEAVWRGAEARTIVDEMAVGQALSIRFVRHGEVRESEREFSLAGFAAARLAYRQRINAFGGSQR